MTGSIDTMEELVAAPDEERRTSNLELFFDLVFVFAITQITSLLLADLTAAGFGRSALMLVLIWWAWSGYAWTTTAIDVDGISTRLGIMAAAAGAFFMAFALPGAFGHDAMWFALSYFAVRALQVVLIVWGVRDNRAYLISALQIGVFFLVAPTLVVVGAGLGGNAQIAVWLVAVGVDLVGTITAGSGQFRVSPSHFAERHGLFVIIALGESIVAIGVGASHAHRDAALAGTILVAFVGVAALWWAYFDFVAGALERALVRRTGTDRGHVSRDVFTYAHLPIVAGIVLFAVAAEKVVAHGGEPLGGPGRFALGASIVALTIGFGAGRYRLIRRLAPERLTAAAVIGVAAALLEDIAAVALLGIVVAALVVALAVEAYRLREMRAAGRSARTTPR